MIVLPAIDILDGKPVRLYQGDYGQSKCVAEDVLACAKKFEKEKANYLHVVDLNGKWCIQSDFRNFCYSR